MKNRVDEIKKKGFSMALDSERDVKGYTPTDFSKIKVGLKTLEDAVLDISGYKKTNPRLADKNFILRAINQKDCNAMREISNYFFRVSGIYSRLCKYMAYLYRYDWYISPDMGRQELKSSSDKVEANFLKALSYFDNFEIKRFLGETALKVIINGCYYGYKIPGLNRLDVQELHPNYCRSRYKVQGQPAVEFNMKFFDDVYRSAEQRMRILNLFPEEFKKGYRLYKQGKLIADFPGDDSGWYLLDPKYTIKFNINGEDYPLFIAAIPSIVDLDEARGLDLQKMKQQLLKIIIQKMPIDKNGDLVFDVDEAQALHNNAVRMLGRAIGVDVLTTFADVDVASLSDTSATTAADESMERAENNVFTEMGTASNLLNTEGSVALEKSILNDEATMYNLIQQFESFLNSMLSQFNKKKIKFRAQILPTTIYNYKDLAKLYKEQTQLGYSKMLPQVALGQAQSTILANAYFENDVLDLVNVFIPPLMSSTMNADVLNRNKTGATEEGQKGRKELPDDQKSDKTIANKESIG